MNGTVWIPSEVSCNGVVHVWNPLPPSGFSRRGLFERSEFRRRGNQKAVVTAGFRTCSKDKARLAPGFVARNLDDHIIPPPEVHCLQIPLCFTSSYTAARPTSKYTSPSTAGNDPKIIPTTFQLEPRKPPRPIRPQFIPPTMRRINATMCKFFIWTDKRQRLADK